MARSSAPRRLTVILLAIALVPTGCPSRLQPRAAPGESVRSPDPGAQQAFESAERQLQTDPAAGQAALDRFVAAHPTDPLEPVARLDAGRAAYERGDFAAARAALQPILLPAPSGASSSSAPSSAPATQLPDDVRERASYYLGLALVHLGDPAGARALLVPLAPRVASGDDATELYAALADADARLGDVTAALAEYDRFFAGATEAEKAYVLDRERSLVVSLSPSGARQAYGAVGPAGPAGALLAQRLADEAAASGDLASARRYLDETATASAAVGLTAPVKSGPSDPSIVGLLVPLTGRARAVGESALRGALLAAGELAEADPSTGTSPATTPPSGLAPVTLLVRDSESGLVATGAAIDELAAAGAIAIIGPIDRNDVAVAATRAAALGVPLLSLAVAGSATPASAPLVLSDESTTFAVLHPPEARARALARHALAAGARRVAILRPDNDYGRLVAAAFSSVATNGGAQVVAEEVYDPKATSFVEAARGVARASPDTVFVADSARKLELVAPALALSGLWSVAEGEKAPRRERPILLVSTAEGVTAQLVSAAGRYLQGATLAPGFYPDDADPKAGPFVAAYRAVFESEPGLFEWASFRAVGVVLAATAAGARSRESLRDALSRPALPGADLSFTPALGTGAVRADPPVLYRIEGDAIQTLPSGSAPAEETD